MNVYKKIPGNINYEITLDGTNHQILDHSKSFEESNGYVRFGYYGITKVVKLNWLALISWFEVDLDPKNIYRIWDIVFVDIVDYRLFKSISRKVMYFKAPIWYDVGYRIIPNYTRYAVSKDGIIIDTKSGQIVKTVVIEDDYQYVYVYDPEYRKIMRVKKHRLIAYAWVKNKKPKLFQIVNHKDGNKLNNNIDNLEWVSQKENNIHAINNSMRSDNLPCTVYDTIKDVTYSFNSVKQAKKLLGYTALSILQLSKHVKDGLLRGKYVLKINDLTIDEYLKTKLRGVNHSTNILVNNGVNEYTFPSLREASKFFTLDKKTIKRLAVNNKIYNGYTFSIVSPL